MRTLKQLNITHDQNYTLFPDGAIKNEIEGTQEGTPVVREVYNDLLVGFYSYLRNRKITPNNLEDNEQNGYQLIQALERNINVLNDTEKILSINGSTWNINLDFSLIPNKYFFFARSSENSNSSIQFIKGTNSTIYPFTQTDFKTGDELLFIFDQSSVRCYNISLSSSFENNFPVFGTPLSFLEGSKKIWYEKDGFLYSDFPESHNIKGRLITYFAEEVEIRSSSNWDGKIFFLVFLKSSMEVRVVYINPNDWENVFELSSQNLPLTGLNGQDAEVMMFMDQGLLYFTNRGNNSTSDNILSQYKIESDFETLTHRADYTLSVDFLKTSSSAIYLGSLVTFFNGNLKKFSFDGTVETKSLPNFTGSIFKVNEFIFFTDGSNATKWII